jgi:hypothetical protein
MNLHRLFGQHLADPKDNHWQDGRFMSSCKTCGRAMEKPPGGDWRLAVAVRAE